MWEANVFAQGGRGLAAAWFGSPYKVYRTSANLIMPGILSSPPTIVNFRMRPDHTTTKAFAETDTFELVMYAGQCNALILRLGDILSGSQGTFCLAQARPLDANLFIRVEQLATILFPFNAASDALASESETAPTRFVTSYGSETTATNTPVTIQGGSYIVGVPGATAALVPVGVQMLRNRDSNAAAEQTTSDPNAPPPSMAILYIPPLGIEIPVNALVTLSDANATQYRVINAIELPGQNFVGTIAIAGKAQAYK